jgi:ribonuclease HI
VTGASAANSLVVVHADESCLGNQNEGPSPGGAGALVESAANEAVVRRDFFLSAPGTTNNRMALTGAIDVLKLLETSGGQPRITYYSDSTYLVKGAAEWAPNWERRGWRRKGGVVENLELWQELLPLSRRCNVAWHWVRGHAGHPKNEYADHLAVSAAAGQTHSGGLLASGFEQWLAHQQSTGKFSGYDPNHDLAQLAKGFATTE